MINIPCRWQNGLVDQEPIHKEILPPTHVAILNSPTPNAKNILLAPTTQTNRARKVNKSPHLHPRGTWVVETLEKSMDVIQKKHFSMKRANQHWHIPLTFLSYHLNGKTKSRKVGPQVIVTNEKDVTMVAQILSMQQCGLSITLQQLKMEVAKLTQTKPTPFTNGIPRNYW